MKDLFPINNPLLVVVCTIGAGGHSEKILNEFPNSRLIGIDIDPKMVDMAQKKLSKYIETNRAKIYHTNYAAFNTIDFSDDFDVSIFEDDKTKFDVILADLGFNSYQLSDPKRGFSYQLDGDLDMRYDQTREDTSTCSDIVNSTTEFELTEIFSKFGDEHHAQRLSREIIKARKGTIIKTTKELTNIINKAFSGATKSQRYKMLTKIFQALRIAVNYEMTNLERLLENIIENLENNGIFIAISFHSGEDSRVENAMRQWIKQGLGASLTRGAITPHEDEIKENSRSHSAKMRVFIKTI